ncbi:MAG: hypothetical protein K2X35_02355 [Bryobacteraceae bacterium]|nr:hypothetical protein [Bryobacteraceae bacterium]
MKKFPSNPIKLIVVWEPVIESDRAAPTTPILKRISDPRAAQFWDPERFISRMLGEKDEETIVWDQVFVYPPGGKWTHAPPQHLYTGRPIVKIIPKLEAALAGPAAFLRYNQPHASPAAVARFGDPAPVANPHR